MNKFRKAASLLTGALMASVSLGVDFSNQSNWYKTYTTPITNNTGKTYRLSYYYGKVTPGLWNFGGECTPIEGIVIGKPIESVFPSVHNQYLDNGMYSWDEAYFNAVEFIEDDIWDNEVSRLAAIDLNAAGGIVLPDSIDGRPVVAIGCGAFAFRRSITSIKIPDTVVYIQDESFFGSCITNFNLPASYVYRGTQIGLNFCSELSSLSIPSSLADKFRFIDGVFYGKEFYPQGYNVFDGSSGWVALDSAPKGVPEVLELPNDTIILGEDFLSDNDMVKSVHIGSSVTNIGAFVFCGCSSLTNITVSPFNKHFKSRGGILYDRDNTLLACPAGLTGKILIPHGTTCIEEGSCFRSGAEEIVIPSTVDDIFEDAFSESESLTSVYFLGDIPDNPDSENPESWHYDLFCDSPDVTVYVPPRNPSWAAVVAEGWWQDVPVVEMSAEVYNQLLSESQPVPTVSVINGAEDVEYQIGSTVSIYAPEVSSQWIFTHWEGEGIAIVSPTNNPLTFAMPATNVVLKPFYKWNPAITDVVCTPSVSGWEDPASGTKSVSPTGGWDVSFAIEDGEIPTFREGTNLQVAVMTRIDGGTPVYTNMFMWVSNTESSVVSAPGRYVLTPPVMIDNAALVAAGFGEKCWDVVSNKLEMCVALYEDTGLFQMGNPIPVYSYIFSSYAKADAVSWGYMIDKRRKVAYDLAAYAAFPSPIRFGGHLEIPAMIEDCPVTGVLGWMPDFSAITSIAFPAGVKTIGSSMGGIGFVECRSLESIEFPEGLESIGANAFMGCSSLKSIVVPDSVVFIGAGAFCSPNYPDVTNSLKSVVIGSGVQNIQSGAFSGNPVENIYWRGGKRFDTFGIDPMAFLATYYDDNGMTYQGFPSEQNLYKVDFSLGYHLRKTGGGELHQEVVEGRDAVPPEFEIDDGWKFLGWSMSPSNITANAVIAADVERLPSYAVSFDPGRHGERTGGGALVQLVCEGHDAVAPEVAAAGCDFAGWDVPFTNICGNVTCTANWTPNASGGSGSGAGAPGTGEALYTYLTVTNVIAHYVFNSVRPEFAAPQSNAVGFVSVVTEIAGGALSVPSDWAANYPGFTERFGGDFASALTKPTGKRDAAGNPMLVWQDYVAGTDPTDDTDVFKASITFVDGSPVISWTPELPTAQAEKRKYTIFGKARLNDADWTEVAEGEESRYNFFKVTVKMR